MELLTESDEPPPFNSIGNTLFTRTRNLERALGFSNIYIKFEGGNPTGTQKDRISWYHIMKAKQQGCQGITVGTCGNYGASLAYFAKIAGLESTIFIPEKYFVAPRRKNEIQQLASTIITVNGKYEDAVEESKHFSRHNNFYDANPGDQSESWNGYIPIATEIFQQLGRAPTAISVPVGNGTTLLGIYHGFNYLLQQGKIDHMPYLVGASTTGGNPIINSFKQGLSHAIDLLPDELRETAVNEPLISYHSYDGNEALHALYETEGWADYASDQRMMHFHTVLKDLEGLSVLPASTSAIEALIKFKNHRQLNSDYVIVLTGRKFR